MKLSDFDYILPGEFIAQFPLEKRDSAKLLVLHRNNAKIEHRLFSDLIDYIDKDELLILNDTKVLPCRLFGRKKTGGKIEVLLLGAKEGLRFKCLIKPSRFKTGEDIFFDSGICAKIAARDEIIFSASSLEDIYKIGVMPLPPYIKREVRPQDALDYQTVYAKKEGAVASPTAGLHFTEDLLNKLSLKGVDIAHVTLHVGLGTFKPVKADDIREHVMDSEHFEVPPPAVGLIEKALRNDKRIFAVGTTSLRALESYAAGRNNTSTDLFIYPGYEFKLTRALVTNFHLPRTTLFMLVCAFAGIKEAKKAYASALDNHYRFYSYGDAMLII